MYIFCFKGFRMTFPVIPVPTMSTQGWVTDPTIKFDKLLADFFLADHNQSYFYKGSIKTLQGLIEKNGTHISPLIGELNQALVNYLERYYTAVEVDVRSQNDMDTDPKGQMTLIVTIGVNDNGTQKQFARLLDTDNGAMKKIRDINDGIQ